MGFVSIDDKLFFFERNFFTLDGLWMIKTEKETNWETALSIDLKVWKEFLKIIFHGLKDYLHIEGNNLFDFIKILAFRWSTEGWDYDILLRNNYEVEITIKNCPYHAAMYRNEERHKKVPVICKDVCIPLYDSLVFGFNEKIKIKRDYYKGLGDNNCNFILTQKDLYPSDKFKEIDNLKKEAEKKGKLFYFEQNFKILDKLWIIEVRKQLNFDTTLKLDNLVWQELYEIIFKRVIKYLNITGRNLEDLIKVLSFIWNCEGCNHEIIKRNKNEIILNIDYCLYIEVMKSITEYHDYIVSICKDWCLPYLDSAIKRFNPKIILKRTKSIEIENNICTFHIKLSD
ncbi:MAG: DUF6125 family protein [Promethearchaeota archaeon]